jgi:hypothetical protein
VRRPSMLACCFYVRYSRRVKRFEVVPVVHGPQPATRIGVKSGKLYAPKHSGVVLHGLAKLDNFDDNERYVVIGNGAASPGHYAV